MNSNFLSAQPLSRVLAEDVNAPELRSSETFALRPRRKASRNARLCHHLFAARKASCVSCTSENQCECGQACSI